MPGRVVMPERDSARRAVATTRWPRRAASTAVAAPMPLEQPVMRTVRCRGTRRCYPSERHMGYADKALAPGETVVYRARYHWIIYRTGLVILVLGALLGVGAFY